MKRERKDDSIMKRMIQIVCICLVFALCLSLCACGAMPDEKVNTFLHSLSTITMGDWGHYDHVDQTKTLNRCLKNDSFPQLLDQYLTELSASRYDYYEAAQLISHLEALQYPALKWLEEYKTKALEGDPADMIAYIGVAKYCSEDIPSMSVIDFFPYAELKDYFETYGKKAIVSNWKGGYYDEHKGEFHNESYWYDPLSAETVSEGSIGTYQKKETYLFWGDFMENDSSKYWYGTSSGDSCNEYRNFLYFRGKNIGSSYGLDLDVLKEESFPNNNIYYLETSDDILIASVEKARIIFVHNGEMVAAAYE